MWDFVRVAARVGRLRRMGVGRSIVVATLKCRINCNEILSPRCRLGNGRQSGAAGEVVDAWHRGFSFLRRGNRRRAALGLFFERQG